MMNSNEGKIEMCGGIPLNGIISISGAKNAALPIMVASLLTKDDVVLNNVPKLHDVENMANIMRQLGAQIDYRDNIMRIRKGNIDPNALSKTSLTREIRYSIHLIGSLLHIAPKIRISLPGGCKIGTRRIDSHIFGLEKLGATVTVGEDSIEAVADRLRGSNMEFEYPSVGATENVMMAACMAEGETTIKNVAKEPEIVDLANFLNSMGADIKGAGSGVLKITGVDELSGVEHFLIPDRIETGTYLVAAAITKGDIVVKNTDLSLLENVVDTLRDIGVEIDESDNGVHVTSSGVFTPTDIVTEVYPGFPTDMQPIISSLLAVSNGESVITEKIFDQRFNHVPELNKMGANIRVDGESIIISGVKQLHGKDVESIDIRSGGGLILAGLQANGVTRISGIKQIFRGYEKPIEKLRGIGADISFVE
jgi:UDP-N-acetylglucosamine 1-carboxyvinyltransferase